MKKINEQPFKGIFQDPTTGKDLIKHVVDNIATEVNLRPVLHYLDTHKNFSKLNIDYSILITKLRPMLETLIDDLEDCKSFINLSTATPVHVKRDLDSLRMHLEGIERIFEASPIISTALNAILSEDIFDKRFNFYLLNSTQVRALINNTTRPDSTIQALRSNSSKLINVINQLSKTEMEKDKEDDEHNTEHLPKKMPLENATSMVLASRLRYFPNIDKKRLLNYAFDSKNRFLFIVAFHLASLAQEMGIDTENGQVTFIHKAYGPIQKHLGDYFSNLGAQKIVKPGAWIELFRSNAWENRANPIVKYSHHDDGTFTQQIQNPPKNSRATKNKLKIRPC